jgi:hypothetical protein
MGLARLGKHDPTSRAIAEEMCDRFELSRSATSAS